MNEWMNMEHCWKVNDSEKPKYWIEELVSVPLCPVQGQVGAFAMRGHN
jgi:hypothetical protein